MNIYCVIFMCTFGANNTDTEMPTDNSLTAKGMVSDNATDVASMILPGKGEPVPQFVDIVMDLPNIRENQTVADSPSSISANEDSTMSALDKMETNTEILTVESNGMPPSVTDILLPPNALHHPKLSK